MLRRLKLVSTAAAVAACVGIAGCQTTASVGAVGDAVADAPAQQAAAPVVLMDLPMTTASDAARAHFLAGLEALDMQDALNANRRFKEAVQADPQFALAHMYVALSAQTTEEFAAYLASARRNAPGASRAEQLIIEGWQHAFDNNAGGQLANTTAVAQLHADSARAWLAHAAVLEAQNRIPEARAAFDRALQIAPRLAAAHMQAGNDYLNFMPKDFDRAARHFETAASLAPDQAGPYDFLGDAHRAQNRLQDALRDYTMAAQRAPDQGLLLQQRGHVNSFLGDYAAARADYDRAVELETARGGVNAPFLAVYRAYVNIYEGDPDAAIAELRALIARVDASSMQGKADLKNFALTNIAQFATHYGRYNAAEAAITELASVTSAQAAAIGNPDFQRAQEANVVFLRGMLAARRGDQNAARAFARRFATIVEPDNNPRKLERMHQILGMAAFRRRDYAGAEAELAQANPNDIYVRYHRALAQSEIGQAQASRQTFAELAVYNFNDPNFAMVRSDVTARAASSGAAVN